MTYRVGCVLEASRVPADAPALIRALRAAGLVDGGGRPDDRSYPGCSGRVQFLQVAGPDLRGCRGRPQAHWLGCPGSLPAQLELHLAEA